jgi:hypothetical protein
MPACSRPSRIGSVLSGLTRAGDVILFENDLPDTYSERPRAHAGARG